MTEHIHRIDVVELDEKVFESANSAYIEVIDEIDAPEAINTFALRAAIKTYLTSLADTKADHE